MTSDIETLVGASRLPTVGTTIFTVMSALAVRTNAINLGQGFPDFDCDPALVDAVAAAMRAGHNQYPPMTGIPALRQAVADKIALTTGRRYDADGEITITAGATQGILSTILALVHPHGHRQHAAQPERHGVDGRGTRALRGAAAADEGAGAVRRGLRAHGVRR